MTPLFAQALIGLALLAAKPLGSGQPQSDKVTKLPLFAKAPTRARARACAKPFLYPCNFVTLSLRKGLGRPQALGSRCPR